MRQPERGKLLASVGKTVVLRRPPRPAEVVERWWDTGVATIRNRSRPTAIRSPTMISRAVQQGLCTPVGLKGEYSQGQAWALEQHYYL